MANDERRDDELEMPRKGLAARSLDALKRLSGVGEWISDLKGLIVSVTMLLLVVVILLLILRDCGGQSPGQPPPEQPPPHGTDKTDTENHGKKESLDGESTVTPVTGRDNNGRLAEFDIYVWDQRFNWVLGENAQVELGGHVMPFREHLERPAIQRRMQRAQALIAVGSASQEYLTLEREEKRADDRARQLATWIEESITKPTYTLSVGRYKASDSEMRTRRDTERQRPIAIIGIVSCTDGLIFGEALRDALYKEHLEFPFSSQKYPRFDLTPQTLQCIGGRAR